MARAWAFLIFAIATEVAGTLMMKASGYSGDWLSYVLMYVLISASYALLSFALRKISVAIAIAIWEGVGTSLITLISVVFLGEAMTAQKALGLVLALCGVTLLHYGEAS